MFSNEEMVSVINSLTIRSYKAAVSKEPMRLSVHQAEALGTKNRNVLRFVKTAIAAIADKLFINSIATEDAPTNDVMQQWLTKNRIETMQRELYKLIVRDGIAYVLVKYENDSPALSIVESYDGKTGAVSIYDAQTKQEIAVINSWYAGATRNVDVYYDNRIEKYTYDNDTGMWITRKDTTDEEWPIDWTDNNNEPLGIALVRFDISESDIVEAVQLQSDMNEAVLDLLATSRTMGWPQRVLKNASQETYLLNQYSQPLLDYGTSYPIPRKIELTPGSILMLQGTDSDLNQLEPATPNTTVLDTLRSLFSQVTTVPQYILNGNEFPSGVALLNAEMRLNHKVESHQGYLTPSFESMLTMMVKVNNVFGDTAYAIDAVWTIVWASPEVYTEDLKLEMQAARVDTVVKLKMAGVISIEEAVRTLHPEWNETEIQNEVSKINGDNTLL
jgi:hypothetical protein